MNGVLQTCHKAKFKKVQVNDATAKIKPNSDKEITEGKQVMNMNRHENNHSLVRNIVYFRHEERKC